jgi:hypothetical protein
MNPIQEIQFIDLETEAPLATVKGDNAQVLLEESELIQTIQEIGGQANPKVLVVPVGKMSTDRQTIFANILKGVPVGKKDQWGSVLEIYPLGEKEERNIKRAVNATGAESENDKQHYTQQERIHVLFEVLRFLILPDDIIQNMLKFDLEDTRPERSAEDDIEQLLETHKKWLYLRGLDQKLSADDYEEAKAFFDKIRETYRQEMKELEDAWASRLATRRMYGYTSYFNSNNNNNNNSFRSGRNIQETYEDDMSPFQYAPVEEEITGNMSVPEYERWLRTVYFKKEPLGMTNQLHLNTLFKENGQALRRGGTRKRKVTKSKKNKKRTRAKGGRGAA